MQDPNEPIRDELLEAFLDGALPAEERAGIEERLRTDPRLQAGRRVQARIDDSLHRLFPLGQAADLPFDAAAAVAPRRATGWPLRLTLPAAAAALIAAALWWSLSQPTGPELFFEPTPLAAVYHDTVRGGFEPYYECSEPERFARTFRQRQSVPLELLPMPPGATMLGLSYSGGLSRDTTAMLCRVDEAPVMVFVDQASRDSAVATRLPAGLGDLRVFREERDGLVLYEVTPLDGPRVMNLLSTLDSGCPAGD